MSLIIDSKSFPKHFPHNPRYFEFDEEVSGIFENMAIRSIPNYVMMHRINAQMMARQYEMTGDEYVVLDFGASTGVSAKMLCNQLQVPQHKAPPRVRYIAIDKSKAMLSKMKESVPWVETLCVDVTKQGWDEAIKDVKANAMLMLYFLQFLKPHQQKQVTKEAARLMRYQGMLFVGAKEANKDKASVSQWMDDLYVNFRLENGYTKEEIQAKTKALKASMHTITKTGMLNLLHVSGFTTIHETTRWLQFMSLVAHKSRKT